MRPTRVMTTLVPTRVRVGILGLRAFVEPEGAAVHAEALSGRPGPVREDVPEVRAAAGAVDLGADHAVRAVLDQLDVLSVLRVGEAGPSGPRVELRAGVEQLEAAGGTVVRAVGLGVDVAT